MQKIYLSSGTSFVRSDSELDNIIPMKTNVKHLADKHRFVIYEEGHTAFVSYLLSGNALIIEHTYVPKPLRGRGLAELLVKSAYDYAHDCDLICQATCSYAASWLASQN